MRFAKAILDTEEAKSSGRAHFPPVLRQFGVMQGAWWLFMSLPKVHCEDPLLHLAAAALRTRRPELQGVPDPSQVSLGGGEGAVGGAAASAATT